MGTKNQKERIEFVANTGEKSNRKFRIGAYAIIAVCFLAVYFLLALDVINFLEKYQSFLKKTSLTIFLIFLVMLIGKLIEKFITRKSQSVGHSYNLIRITRLLTNLFVFIVILSFLFQNWYTAAVSFGLLSLILGFALQVPISSFIAWLYIIFRTPYRVGDRIQLNGFKGDVMEIDYLDTTLLEFSGDYLSNDRRSGRVVRFPNSIVMKSEVFNYSGPQMPFIWNEAAFQIAYTSDLKFVEETLLAVTEKDFIDRHGEARMKKSLAPAVYFRVNSYSWLEAVVSYPVLPTETTPRRTRIIKKTLAALNAQPEKVLFPEGTSR